MCHDNQQHQPNPKSQGRQLPPQSVEQREESVRFWRAMLEFAEREDAPQEAKDLLWLAEMVG